MKFSNQPTLFALSRPFSSLITGEPADASSWCIDPDYISIPLELESSDVTPVDGVPKRQKRQIVISEGMFNQKNGPNSHHYELIDNSEKFQLTVDVPGVKEEDIEIGLEDRKLSVKGKRASTSGSFRSNSEFYRSFSLDPTINVDQLTATLNNGVLVVSAPKEELKKHVRRIPITSSPKANLAESSSNKTENNVSIEKE